MSISSKILMYCSQRLNKKEGDGECWTLAENAVVSSGGKSSKPQTPSFGPHANYVWGTPRNLGSGVPGYILQFKNYKWLSEISIKITFEDGSWFEETSSQSEIRPHHTVIFSKKLTGPFVEIIEQNAPVGSSVHKTELVLKSVPKNTVTTLEQKKHDSGEMRQATVLTTTEHKVSGNIWIYEAKPAS